MAAPVIDLEHYRSARIDTALADVAADEQATGAQLLATWTDALQRFADPTYAHLSELAAVVDDVLEADSYEAIRIALNQVMNGAVQEMAKIRGDRR